MNNEDEIRKVLEKQDKLDEAIKALNCFKMELKAMPRESEFYTKGKFLLKESLLLISERYAQVAIQKAKLGLIGRQLYK